MPISGDVYATWPGTLSGAVHEVFKKGSILNQYPVDNLLLNQMGGFTQAQPQGENYVWPLGRSFSQGHTYAAAGAGAFPFRKARPGKTEKAKARAVNHFHRIATDWETLAITEHTPEAGWEQAAQRVVSDMRTGFLARIEDSLWCAGTTLAVFKQGSASVVNVDIGDGAQNYLQVSVTYETWGSYLFVAKEGAGYDFYATTGSNATAFRPTGPVLNNTAVVTLPDGTTTNASLDLAAVYNVQTRTLLFSGAAGDYAAVLAAVNAPASQVGIVYWGQLNADFRGMDDVLTNTSSTLYDINVSRNLFMRAHVRSNGSLKLTLGRIYEHLQPAISVGLTAAATGGQGEAGIYAYLNPVALADLIDAENVLRRHMDSGGTAKNGFQTVTYDSQVGPITFFGYPRIKQGEAYFIPAPNKHIRVLGSKPPTLREWGPPQGDIPQYFRQIEGVAAVEASMYANISAVWERPSWCTKVTEIRSSGYVA